MDRENAIKLFEDRKVRVLWDEVKEKWYFSIIDVIDVLTDSINATSYWRKLKERMKKEGNETVTKCHGLKMKAIVACRNMSISCCQMQPEAADRIRQCVLRGQLKRERCYHV